VSAGPVAERAARLAAAVAWLSDAEWSREVARLAADRPGPSSSPDPPTVGDVARDGVALVEGLAAGGRWEDAAVQATHLARYFAREGLRLGPIAAEAFDGVRAATLARDRDELADFVELVREMFS
jgi:hypothetical protein